jgi:kynurenine formamidase
MHIYDISWPISSATTGYKDRNIVKLEPTKNFEKDGVRESEIHLSSHTGTHVDAPAHFLRDGKVIDEVTIDL